MNEQFFYIITLVIGTASATLILLEIRSNHAWNQMRTSYELMNEMMTSGRMTGALDRLGEKFGWNMLSDSVTYDDVVVRIAQNCPESSLEDLHREVVILLRHLEMLSISMSHGIVREKFCKDGFVALFLKIHEACSPFINEERRRRGDDLIYENFERFALKWRREEDRRLERENRDAAPAA